MSRRDRPVSPVPEKTPDNGEIITLRELLSAVDTAVVELVEAPAGDDVVLESVALVTNLDNTGSDQKL